MSDIGFTAIAAYSEKDTEHAHQSALFQWIAMARLAYGCVTLPGGAYHTNTRLRMEDAWFMAGDDGKAWLDRGAIQKLDLLFAIPNGGQRDRITASRLKAEGVKPGVPDVMWPVSRRVGNGVHCGFHGLFIEMKRPEGAKGKKGVVSKKQEPWHRALTHEGYCVMTCYSVLEALQAIRLYWG